MNLHFSYKAKRSADAERELHMQVDKLDRRLQVFRPELVHLHGTLESQARTHQYAVSLNLRLPSGQISAKTHNSRPSVAIKNAFTDIMSQLRKHKELLRQEHKWNRGKAEGRTFLDRIELLVDHNLTRKGIQRAHVEDGMAEIPEPLSQDFRDITPATFARGHRFALQSDVRKYINAKLERLEKFVAREIHLMESQGRLEHGEVATSEVIDEVVMHALSAEARPQNLSLERWFYQISLHTLRRMASETKEDRTNLHIEQHLSHRNVTASDEDHLQFHQPGDALQREDVIADLGMGTPEQLAASDELMDQLDRALVNMPVLDREAFLMLTVDGFELNEIAHLTHRTTDELRGAILRARDQIIQRLPSDHAFKDHLVRQSSVA